MNLSRKGFLSRIFFRPISDKIMLFNGFEIEKV